MIATIENHCQRERRSRSNLPVIRNTSDKRIFRLASKLPRARMHPTAKKPASSNSSHAVLSIETLRQEIVSRRRTKSQSAVHTHTQLQITFCCDSALRRAVKTGLFSASKGG